MSKKPPDQRLKNVNGNTAVGYCALEAANLHRVLDEEGVPRECEHGNPLSLQMRVRVWHELELKRITMGN